MRENKVLHVYYGERLVGTMALTESKKAAFEYADEWLADGFLSALFHFHWKNGFLFPQKIIFEGYSACLQTACRMRGDSYC